uniref:Phospholipid phosphatase 1 n=1 Tax=Oncorhynchus kisutch TaxID=8019 RepID=A0A8C7MEI6_ONCKI
MFETGRIPLVLLDVTCLILVGLPFVILTPQHNPFNRGFFCNDESIRYPLKEDTISYQLLGGVMIPFTLIVVVSGECLGVYMTHIKTKSSLGANYVARIYKAVGSFLFGAAASQSLTDIAKYSIGRLRPHFLAVCKPMWDRINCIAGGYIENFTCTGDKNMVDEARLSFFSGHSSFSMYCMLFLAVSIAVGILCSLLHTVMLQQFSSFSVPKQWLPFMMLMVSFSSLSLLAVHPGQTADRVGQAPQTHHPVLPDGNVHLRGADTRLRLQTPLE